MTDYALTGFSKPAGTFNITLRSDHAGLTKPTWNTVVELGDRDEDVEYRPFIYDTGTLQMVLAEDYTTYDEGFWWKVLESNNDYRVTTEFKVELDDGEGSSIFYWGRVAPGGIVWDERYDDTVGDYVRVLNVTLMPIMSKLKDVVVSDIIANIKTGATIYKSSVDPDGDTSLYGLFVKATAVFGQIMATAGFSSTVTVVADDIGYKYSGNYYGLSDVYIYIGAEVIATGIKIYRGVFDSAKAYYWPNRYQSGWDLLQAMCRTFGVVARFDLQSGGSHQLDLYARRRSFNTLVEMEKHAMESEARSADELLIENVRIVCANNSERLAYIARVGTYPTVTDYAILDAEPPPDISFDVDYRLEFSIDKVTTDDELTRLYYLTGGSSPYTWNAFSAMRFYDYQAGANSSDYTKSREAIRDYVARLYREPRKILERTYGSMKCDDGSTVTFLNLKPFVRIEVDQGDATRTFYAKKITFSPEQNTATVEWLEE